MRMKNIFCGAAIVVSVGVFGNLRPAHAITVNPVSVATDTLVGGVRAFFYPTQPRTGGGCEGQKKYPSSLNVLDPTTASIEFDVAATKTLTAINDGVSVGVDDTKVSIRVEASTSSGALSGTGLPLQAVSGNTSRQGTRAEYLKYGTTDSVTKRIAISLRDLTVADGVAAGTDGLCDIMSARSFWCQPDIASTPTPLYVKFGVVQTDVTFAADDSGDVSTEEYKIVFADCPAGAASGPTFSAPTLSFGMIPGDQRVKIVNATVVSVDSTVVPVNRVVVYGDTQTTVTTSSPVQREFGQTSNSMYTIDGLSNDTRYCFSLGYVNAAGLVTTSPGVTWSSTLQSNSNIDLYCATPRQVEGFLNRSTCFIASAAYGDEWDPRLEVLRQFRDQILEKSAPGKAFVNWYYNWSPQAAHWVIEHPVYRDLIVAALLPMVEAARVALWLRNNLWVLAIAFVLGTIVVVTVTRRRIA